ncbi:RNA polymerase sigma factor [Jidongwangia harbinensis]|uniref:RNA polymerase sigma factor n=1 Tax=Jidongwangia harbinensis TaxID=2878561 RepID=UPI001CDA4C61|nr:sigma-70 family RNA polymerase sigma factor [Jidongwangia harbinensis]MCA2212895.1 sigma-70 family RNA polymerase sigma factor [Jidongwangia harbinensis]
MGVLTDQPWEDLLRDCAPQVLGAVVRRYGDFDRCEDAVQEALLAAWQQWPVAGVPEQPRNWLITVAARRRIELLRNEAARRRREEEVAYAAPVEPPPATSVDDSLTLLLLCCHPALTPSSQVALTLRAVGGLTTAEIARALLVPEKTVGQRISRAKQRIRDSGARFRLPPPAQRAERLAAVHQVLYLIFNEGYTASAGPRLHRVELTAEAIRLTRQLHARLPDDGEVAGLLALMLLTDARRPARTRPDGGLVPLAEQDRSRWDAAAIAEGVALISDALARAPLGPYQLQAAIAAVHDEAARGEDTDWRQILELYGLLRVFAPGPMVTLNRIVALAMADGPAAGLAELAESALDPALAGHHRVAAVRAHLLEMAGDRAAARDEYARAARLTLSVPEQRYLESRAARLTPARRPS